MRMNKKGISPLIATVLIIGFTIVLSALVITWGTGLFKKTVASTETLSKFNILCTNEIDFDGAAKYHQNGNTLQVTANNKKATSIYGFFFTVKGKDATGADLPTKTFTTHTDIGQGTGITNPVPPALQLDAFGTRLYEMNAGSGYDSVDLRAIVKLDTGERSICDNAINIIVQ